MTDFRINGSNIQTNASFLEVDHIAEKTAAHGVAIDGITLKDDLDTSGICDKTTAQTLTNKTLTNPVINYINTTIGVNVKARAYLSADLLNLTTDTWTKLNLNTESYDVGSNFDAVTNYRFNAPVTGYYLVSFEINFINTTADKLYMGAVRKNADANAVLINHMQSSKIDALNCSCCDVMYLVANDYLELYAIQYDGVSTSDISATNSNTYLTVHLLSV